MGQKRTPGLIKREGVWHIDKQIDGRRICQSCGTSDRREAEECLARVADEYRQAKLFGVRPKRTFEQAAAKYVLEHQHKRSLRNDISRLKPMVAEIGDVHLDRLHRGTLEPWIAKRRKQGVANGTINHGIKIVRRIMNLAASEWVDENGLTWVLSAPKFTLLPDQQKRKPYPLSWEEQDRLFQALPDHLEAMALFAVNTGCRDAEICGLKWEWQVSLPTLETSVFVVPGDLVKNGDDRLIVLNDVASSVIKAQRSSSNCHETFVFHYKGKPVTRMLNTAWMSARSKADLETVRVHDLKHTYGRRLRAAGVSFEDRQDLLGHRAGRITTHYSAAELSQLIEASNTVCERGGKRPELVVIRRVSVS